jgi:methionyl-tRNA formyltransferase
VSELRDADGKAFDPFRQIMSGRLPLQRGVHRQDDLVDIARFDAGDERVDGKVFGTDAFERGEAAAKNVKAAREQAGALQGPKVGDFLYHAERSLVAAEVGADRTRIGSVDIAAGRTGFESFIDGFQGGAQRTKRRLALLEQVEHGTARRTGAEAGKTRQRLGQGFDFGRRHREQIGGCAPARQRVEGVPMRIIFMGTPDFAVPTLEALVAAGHAVVAAYSQPPRPGGRRGRETVASPVQQRAERLGIAVRHPVSLRGADEQAAFAALDADVAVVAAYGLILPKAVLASPRHGCLNVHGSLLPRWRGAAPVQRAILAGDAETGVGIMQMEAGLDTGPVRLAGRVAVTGKTAGDLTTELAALGARLMVEVLDDLAAHPPVPQLEKGVTYASKIDKAEARIDFTRSATEVERLVRAMNPAPGAWFEVAGERVKVLAADVLPFSFPGGEGTTVNDALTIACGDGAIRPTLVQRAGRGVTSGAEMLRGFPVKSNTQLNEGQL